MSQPPLGLYHVSTLPGTAPWTYIQSSLRGRSLEMTFHARLFTAQWLRLRAAHLRSAEVVLQVESGPQRLKPDFASSRFVRANPSHHSQRSVTFATESCTLWGNLAFPGHWP